jgi:hypothetical protein
MITFRKIYEIIFSSFRVSNSRDLLNELEQEKVENIIIIKRSWIYGLFMSLIFILILITLGINISLMIINYSSLYIFYGFVGVIVINVILIIYSGIRYVIRFRKAHDRKSMLTGVHDIAIVKTAIQEEEIIFNSFFNQITLNYFLFFIITIGYLYYLIIWNGEFTNPYSLAELFFLIIQIILVGFYRRHMIDLEMDYVLVVPNRVYFVDQIGIHRRTQSIKWVTNIRLITSSYPNFLWSLCNYGTIEVIVKNDTPAIAESYHMRYVNNPIEIVNQINMLIEESSNVH